MLNVFLLNVILPNATKPKVVMLNVVALPTFPGKIANFKDEILKTCYVKLKTYLS